MPISTRSNAAPRSPRSTSRVQLALAVAFGNGVLSFAAPCTVALLPAYLGVLSGGSAGLPAERRAGRLMLMSLAYVAGLGVVFGTLGVLAGSRARGIDLAEPPVQRTGGLVVLLVAAFLVVDGRTGLLSGSAAGGDGGLGTRRWLWTPLAAGIVFGAAFTPCVGPFLATALELAGNTANAARGGLLLLGYALGVGVPFLLAAIGLAGSERLGRALRRNRATLSYAAAGGLAVLAGLLLAARYDLLSGWLERLVVVSSS